MNFNQSIVDYLFTNLKLHVNFKVDLARIYIIKVIAYY